MTGLFLIFDLREYLSDEHDKDEKEWLLFLCIHKYDVLSLISMKERLLEVIPHDLESVADFLLNQMAVRRYLYDIE